MAIVGLFYGSDTGNTENIARMIQKQLGAEVVDIRDIAKSTKEDIEAYDFLMLGIPTWYYGEAQCDWDDFFPTLEEIDFTDKLVAIFGCGDQEDYAEYFCDAMGTIRNIIEPKGQSSSDTYQRKATPLKCRKHWLMTAHSSVYVLTKIANLS